tara:strand:- start:76 stop:1062 length:987 start_codon:yes stop_codon:yes gene_type:complete
MKRRVLILKPRLDLPFKRFGLNIPNKNIIPIRVHWQNFVDKLHEYHTMRHDRVVVIEEEKWKLSNLLLDYYAPDIAYIPHTDKKTFMGIDENDVCRYYMQTVFPWLFTIDKEGWGGNASHAKSGWEVAPDEDRTYNLFKERADRGESKFDQPTGKFVNNIGDYIFVPLQLPHDETIRYHSNLKVITWAVKLMDWSYENKINLVFKNHPANPASLEDVRQFTKRMDNCYFIDHEINIHSLFKQAKAVYVINSGSAKEAMLHDVPIVRFGRADYNFAVIEGDINDLDRTWQKVLNQSTDTMKENYRTFYNWFINRICYDSTNIGSFLKLR